MDCNINCSNVDVPKVPKQARFVGNKLSVKTSFDKHKSWYKLDVDGDFITKHKDKLTNRKEHKKTLRKPIKTHVVIENESKMKSLEKSIVIVQKPEYLAAVHEATVSLAIHFVVAILFLLLAFASYAFFSTAHVGSREGYPLVKDSLPKALTSTALLKHSADRFLNISRSQII